MNKIPDAENAQALKTAEMNIPNQYDNVDWGARTKLVNKKIVHKDSKTGVVYGSKVIVTKEDTTTFADFLINEGDDVTLLPDSVIAEIRKNINLGAKDLQQKWQDALELVNKAYQVASIRRPLPNEKGAWKQYEELIRHGVRKLAEVRGINGPWRSSTVLMREDSQQDMGIAKRRFFVQIPGEAATEVIADSMDEIIDQLTNKIRRNGGRARVEKRDVKNTTMAVYVGDIIRERLVIKEVS